MRHGAKARGAGGVDVGKSNRMMMADFTAVLQGVHCADVTTCLQSGNPVVTVDPVGLEDNAERALRAVLVGGDL